MINQDDMNTQTIIMPNQDKLAQMASEAHHALPWQQAPDFYPKCCGVLPWIKKGPAIIASVKCPICSRSYGVWSWGDVQLINGFCETEYYLRLFGPMGPFGPLDKVGLLKIFVSKDVWVREGEDPQFGMLFGLELEHLDKKKVAIGYPGKEKFILNGDRRSADGIKYYLATEKDFAASGYFPGRGILKWQLEINVYRQWELQGIRELVDKLVKSIREEA